MTGAPDRDHWVRKMLVGASTAAIFSGAVLSGIGWLVLPRIDERVIAAMASPAGQIAACGAVDCRSIVTRVGVLELQAVAANAIADVASPTSPCLRHPTGGMSVADGHAGQWVAVRIVGVCRLRGDCGLPSLRFTLVNGGGVSHDMEASFSGREMALGECADFNYRVRYPTEPVPAHPGFGSVLLAVTYPEMTDPPLPMTIGPAPVRVLEVPADADAAAD